MLRFLLDQEPERIINRHVALKILKEERKLLCRTDQKHGDEQYNLEY